MISVYQIGQNSKYNIEINDFSGPVSVLIDLVQKKKISIYEVSISSIIKDFFKYIKKNRQVILEEISGFIYFAAVLLELKAKALIPSRNTETEVEENTDLEVLRKREQEYKIFREISNCFSAFIERESEYFVREAPLEEQFLSFMPEIFKQIKITDLHNIASKLLISKEEKISIASFYREKITKTIFQEINRIKEVLGKHDNVTFRELTNTYTCLIDIFICFLSILELYKNEFIDIEQFELFGEILIKKTAV